MSSSTATYYREQDADPRLLHAAKVAVLGYGSQGRAHALNLRDSGLRVVVGARANGPSAKQAGADGLSVAAPADAVRGADLVALLVPDMAQPALYREAVAPNLRDGATLLFAHGFNVHYRQIEPRESIDVSMVAPKGPGNLVRRQYENGQGVPCLVAVHQDATGRAFDRALAYAHHIGGTRAGVIRTTFAEETETDLFGEQAVLCGGVTELVTACWDTLTKAGYSPEVAYFECMHELKLIVDLLYEGGLARMHKYVSDTAKYGDLTRGPQVIDARVRENIRAVLADVRSGAFAEEWIKESTTGGKNFRALLEKDLNHPIEEVGRRLRERMSWLPRESNGVDAR
jgi:ketol-acid reductoisomerase